MDFKRLYEAIDSAIKQTLDLYPDSYKGRPYKVNELSNLYTEPTNNMNTKFIRGYVNTKLKNNDRVYYVCNDNDLYELWSIYIGAIYTLMLKHKPDDRAYDWMEKDKYFASIYGFYKLEDFRDDLMNNYDELSENRNFPSQYIKLVKPTRVHKKKVVKKINPTLVAMAKEYISDFGEGEPLDELDERTIRQYRNCTLKKDGVVYKACRWVLDPDSPVYVYPIRLKYTIPQSNGLRYAYKMQCEYEAGYVVDYLYCSPLSLNTYLNKKAEDPTFI